MPQARVTLLEKRWTPQGLVRYGVAPDHPEVKNVTSKFDKIASGLEYVGNVTVGRDVSVQELRAAFHGVVFAFGSTTDRDLDIPGEKTTQNVWKGRDFVGWYNGDPACSHLEPVLDRGDTAVVVGQGNVALDCARLLLSPISALHTTDIAKHALDALRKSTIRHVHVVGRRGVIQASFTSKEVREMMTLPDVAFFHDNTMVPAIEDASAELSKSRPKKRLMDILQKGSAAPPDSPRSWTLDFLQSPIRIVSNASGFLEGVEMEKNRL
ncbi:NADPH-adrenodoxin reductase, partial [Kappamyces sp. JEL0680]